MKHTLLIMILSFVIVGNCNAQPFSNEEINQWKEQAARIEIIRDNMGTPHIYTQTDADAVFGMMYVQCESFFSKIESSVISRLGREAEVSGKTAIYKDLWSRMYIDTAKAKKLLTEATPYMQKLCKAYAAGINYFLLMHPEIKPKLINRFQPWMPLMNNIPAIAGSNVTEAEVKNMYPLAAIKDLAFEPLEIIEDKMAGSNGWAISPKLSKSKTPLLLINPHSEFYNRIEVQLVSKEGLNVYGAPFLGEFHIWQGFNEFCGWMHTVTTSDAKDLYVETVQLKNGVYVYQYNHEWKPVDSARISISYKNGDAKETAQFTVYRTHHGPVVAKRNEQWLSAKTINANNELLSVHWNITKSKTNKEFVSWLNKRVMTGTNTIYADKTGNIAYWHGNFVPKRAAGYDWTRPVPGDIKETEWQGTHALEDIPNYFNPKNGWVQNCNSSPLYGIGYFDSVMFKKPSYMFPDGHTPRAMNAIRMLSKVKDVTIDSIISMSNDTYLMNAQRFIPALIESYKKNTVDSFKQMLKTPIDVLQQWNYRTDTNSIATTLGVLWVEKIMQTSVEKLKKPITNEEQYAITNGSNISLTGITSEKQLQLLTAVIAELKKDWGTWEIAWGTINRYQRTASEKEPDDNRESLAVTATPGFMGSLNAYVSKKGKETKKRYGASGNTFVAVVSFGKKLNGKSILTGGSSSDAASPHFTDQANGYLNHQYKPILFYKEDVLKNKETIYHPGEERK